MPIHWPGLVGELALDHRVDLIVGAGEAQRASLVADDSVGNHAIKRLFVQTQRLERGEGQRITTSEILAERDQGAAILPERDLLRTDLRDDHIIIG